MAAIIGDDLNVERLAADLFAFHCQSGGADMESALLISLQSEGVSTPDRVRHRAVDHRETRTRRGERASHHGKALKRRRLEILALGVGLENHLETLAHHDLLLGGNGQGGVVLRPKPQWA